MQPLTSYLNNCYDSAEVFPANIQRLHGNFRVRSYSVNAMAQDDSNTEAAVVLERLQHIQQTQELSIIRLGALIDGMSEDETGKRSSDVSTETQPVLNPASLETDLAHYKVC